MFVYLYSNYYSYYGLYSRVHLVGLSEADETSVTNNNSLGNIPQQEDHIKERW